MENRPRLERWSDEILADFVDLSERAPSCGNCDCGEREILEIMVNEGPLVDGAAQDMIERVDDRETEASPDLIVPSGRIP